MNTQPTSKSFGSTDREALDEAHIRLRSGGRQLVIDTGASSREMEDEPREIDPGHGGEPAVKDQIVGGFSDCARRRLRKRLHGMSRSAEGIFLTLTYHEVEPSPDECKAHLDLFWKALSRRFSGISAIWKMEPQERGVPHFHLIVYGLQFIPLPILSKIWHRVTGESSHKHRKAGVDVERFVNEDGKLQAYLGKYMAETYDSWPGTGPGDPWAKTGRWWGCLGRKHLPWADWDDSAMYLHPTDARRIIRALLDEWGVDMPEDVMLPSLTVCTRGNPEARLGKLLDRL